LAHLIFRRRAWVASAAALLAIGCTEPATTGSLTVNVTGLPAGTNAAVRVTGPNDFDQIVQQTTTLPNLLAGAYVITRDTVRVDHARYGVPVVTETVTIRRGGVQTIDVAYGLASSAITVSIGGLPTGTSAAIVLRGPLNPSGLGSFEEFIADSRTIHALYPGSYEIVADTAQEVDGDRFATVKRVDTIALPASLQPVARNIQYNLISGSLDVTINGLPGSIVAEPVVITGPGGFERRVAQSSLVRGLLAGTYTISAENTSVTCQNVLTASNSPFAKNETAVISVGGTSSVAFDYVERPASPDWLNLRIAKAYLTQATQNPQGTVPMITGKQALLRVFGVANQCNAAKPQVRLTLSTGTQITIDAVEDSVRIASGDAVLGASWNYLIPASVVQSGLNFVAEIDPANTIAEANEADNRFPSSGVYTPDIRVAPVVGVRFVPVRQSINNLTGRVNAGNIDQFLEWPRKLHPVGTFDADLHSPYTTAQPALTANATSTWTAILAEIKALQQAENSARYYYGVVRVTYNSGIAGIAYVPGKTGLGWDVVPGSGSRIMAHEMGHNFGRLHAPCGGPSGVDGSYPSVGSYSGGHIGAIGWDPVEGLKASEQYTDIMGYCGSQWISDYTYVGMLNGILSQGPSLPSVSNQEQPALLIWGRIVNGEPELEPAFEISARPSLPSAGPHRIIATDANGEELFAVSFAGERVADIPDHVETFAFTVPVSALRGRTLGALKLTTRGRTASTVATGDVASDPGATVTRVNAAAARIRWDVSRFPVVLVRDASGQVLSFARGGDVTIATTQSQLDLNFSNRVRSTRRLKEFK
jgi:hypothetical protein